VRLAADTLGLFLARGDVVRLDAALGVEVRCEQGRAWITEEACARDVWLAPGERAILCGKGLALLEGDGPTRVRISRPI
jgi:hypothetical protein